MSTNQEANELISGTLRKIGRNLLNYQIVEKIWKAQLNMANVETVIKNGEIKIINAPVLNRNIPMGWLSESHRKALFSPSKEKESEKEIEHITMKTSFRIGEGELSPERKRKVLKLVRERNELVHVISEKFNHVTGAGCSEICAILDEQNVRILEEIEYLNGITTAIVESIAELQKYFQSEEFINQIENNF